MDAGDFEGFADTQIGQETDQTGGQHCLARPRRTDQQQVMAARSGDLHGRPADLLPLDFRQVIARDGNVGRRLGGQIRPAVFSAKGGDQSSQREDRANL